MRPIFDALTDKKFNSQIQFHMPGHLRGRGFEHFDLNMAADVTELPETDDLHAPTGVIKKSQDNAARIFGAKKAYYLVNGSTCGILAMVLGFVRDGEKIIADRYCHKSFVSALALSGAVPVWVNPPLIENDTMWGSLRVEDVERAIAQNPDAKAVYITAPNYFGIMGDVKRLAEAVHAKGMYLLVDSAHGAHYGMHEKLPPSLISLGADAVCISLHKTLPSLTQTAMLLANDTYERVEAVLKMVQTSSPSYIFTSSCEYATEFYEKCPKEAWDRLFDAVERYFPEQINLKNENVKYKDFTRLNCPVLGNSFKMTEILREKYNIATECAYGGGVMAILNSFHTEDEIKKLRQALDEIELPPEEPIRIVPFEGRSLKSPREVFFGKKRYVPLKDAEGKISASGIMVYPPGVYQVLPGEVITREAVEIIMELIKKGADIPAVNQSNCLILDE